jgi:uncharacterized protein (TIGR00299 family) protein
MALAALLDAGASLDGVRAGIDSLGLQAKLSTEIVSRRGFRGLRLAIDHPPEHAHRGLLDISNMIRRGRLTHRARGIALRLFERLARAEARVHGVTIDQVHFHEVGAVDSIVDMVGVAIAWDMLEIEQAYASPVPVGGGVVKTSHGMIAVPAPATIELLADVPIASCGIPFEMTTPTGAAILAELVNAYGPLPSMQVSRIGYGAGMRDIPDRPNLLRVMLGHAAQVKKADKDSHPFGGSTDSVLVLETNLDDISGEQIGFAIEMLWGLGALDVFTTAIQMKKNRPGVLLTVICRSDSRDEIERALFKHTGTLGIRSRRQVRKVLPRAMIEVDTQWGLVPGKLSRLPSGVVDFSPEHDECRAIAREHDLRLADVVREVIACYHASLSNASQPLELEPSISEQDLNLELQKAAWDDSDFDEPTSQPR